MKKKNVKGLEQMAEDYLQYRWGIYLHTKKRCGEEIARPDFVHYSGACDMLGAMGMRWERTYRGNNTQEQLDDISLYSHWVSFPSDEACERLNFDAWK